MTGLRWLMPAAAVLTLAASGTAAWMGIDNARLRRTLASEASNPTPVASVPAPAGPTMLLASADGIVQAALTPERLRGSGNVPRIALQPTTQVIRFTLAVPEEFPSYDVLIERLGAGEPIARQLGLHRNPDKSVSAWVSSDLLADGDYEILLNGTRDNRSELIAVYGYRIARTPSQPTIERPQP
jgi:hypothetical protein